MSKKTTVLVTGVAGYWGGRVAMQLLAQPGLRVIGLDSEPPKEAIKGLDFIQSDIRNPLLVDLLKAENVDTLCHLAFSESHQPNEATFDLNVMGAMKVFGACALTGVRKIVLKSSTAVYGALPSNSAFLSEEKALKGSHQYGSTRDMVEIEAFCNGFRRQAPDILMTILRFPSIIGPTVDSQMTRFLREPLTPTLWGFNPMMQVIHENDVAGALVQAVLNDCPGVFNVAAEGVLPLEKLMGLAGKFGLPVFHLFAYWGTALLGGAGLRLTRHTPFELDYIRYPWVGDLAKMRAELGFTPHYTAEEALREFAGHMRMSRYIPEHTDLGYDEERLRDTIERRRRISASAATRATEQPTAQSHDTAPNLDETGNGGEDEQL